MFDQLSVKKALQVEPAISSEMAAALVVWSDMYRNQASWLGPDIRSLSLPAAIAGEISRLVTIEMQVEITGGARAEYLQEQLQPVLDQLRTQVERGCALGGMVLKPYVLDGRIIIDFVMADQLLPVEFDSSGDIVACVFADQRTIGDKYYTRLEYHRMVGNSCEISNLAFRSATKDTLGTQVPLTDVAAWSDLLPAATILNVDRPLFAYFRYPISNNVDPASPLGVSCYSRAVDLVEQADRLWSNLLWEFESGKRAIYVDSAAFSRDIDGRLQLPDRRLYRALNMSGNLDDEDMFREWSPELREAALRSGLDTILKRIEFTCGLAYGTLSDPQSVEKTATEIAVSRQRTYATVTDTQRALEVVLEQLLWAMDTWSTLAALAPAGAYSVSFAWDDSVIVDKDAQFQQDARLVNMGLMSKWEFRMRNMGEDEKTAKQRVADVQAEQPADAFAFGG